MSPTLFKMTMLEAVLNILYSISMSHSCNRIKNLPMLAIPIDLHSDEFYQIHALSSRHPPPSRPGYPPNPPFRPQSQQPGPQKSFKMYDGPISQPPQIYKLLSQHAVKALKAYNTETLNRFHKRKVHNTDVMEIPQDDPPEPSEPDSGLSDLHDGLDIPEDPHSQLCE